MKPLFMSLTLITVSIIMSACIMVIKERRGNGEPCEDLRQVESFLELEAIGSVDIHIVSGEVDEIFIEGDSNLVPHLQTRVEGRRLIIGPRNGEELHPNLAMRAVITTTQSLEAVTLVGTGNIVVEDITAQNFETNLIGEGRISLNGTARDMKASIVGDGTLDARALETHRTKLEVVGESHSTVCASESLDVEIVGSSHVTYYCSPTAVNRSGIGSGSLEAR